MKVGDMELGYGSFQVEGRSNWKRKAFLVAMGTAMTALMILLGLDQSHEISEPTRQTLSTQRVSTPLYSWQILPHTAQILPMFAPILLIIATCFSCCHSSLRLITLR
mmetsp:Transcript_52653/g.163409  ORF Transcript_52653/g.163409 Transcript_52653/m.163409 type:complete len:107 (-) Transcript_52653:2879-3199(-)